MRAIAIVVAMIFALVPWTSAFASDPCVPASTKCHDRSVDRDVTSTKDVDNEKDERRAERGEEVENEAAEESQETRAQEQKETQTTTTHESNEKGGSSGSAAGERQNRE